MIESVARVLQYIDRTHTHTHTHTHPLDCGDMHTTLLNSRNVHTSLYWAVETHVCLLVQQWKHNTPPRLMETLTSILLNSENT